MRFFSLVAVLFWATLACFTASADLNLYTDRPQAVADKLAADFEAQTGIRVLVTDVGFPTLKGLLASEGADSPADVIYTKDAMNLGVLNQSGFFQALPDDFNGLVDPSMLSSDKNWVSITYYARTLVYEASLDVSGINSYEDLAKPDYQGTLCLTAPNIEVSALVASLVLNYDYDKAQSIVTGWVANRVEQKFYDSDTTIVKTIATGALTKDGSGPACYLAFVDSYEVPGYLLSEPNAPIKMKFLKQGVNGTATNGTGAGISKSSKQKDVAAQFIKFLLSAPVQAYLTQYEQSFASAIGVKTNNTGAEYLPFTMSPVNWNDVGNDEEEARLILIDSHYK